MQDATHNSKRASPSMDAITPRAHPLAENSLFEVLYSRDEHQRSDSRSPGLSDRTSAGSRDDVAKSDGHAVRSSPDTSPDPPQHSQPSAGPDDPADFLLVDDNGINLKVGCVLARWTIAGC